MLFTIRTRRKEAAAWEVVDSESVDPVPTYYDDEGTRSQSPHRPPILTCPPSRPRRHASRRRRCVRDVHVRAAPAAKTGPYAQRGVLRARAAHAARAAAPVQRPVAREVRRPRVFTRWCQLTRSYAM